MNSAPDFLSASELDNLKHADHGPTGSCLLYKYYDEAANRAQGHWRRVYFRWSVIGLAMISLLSAATGLGPWLHEQVGLAKGLVKLLDVAGIALTTAGVIAEIVYQVQLRTSLTPWTTARDQAETLRSAVWLYLFDIPLYADDRHQAITDADASWRRLLLAHATYHPDRQQAAYEAIGYDPAQPDALLEPTAELRFWKKRLSQLSITGQAQAYRAARLDDQRTYFHRAATKLRARANRYARLNNVLLGAAIVWNVVRLVVISMPDPTWHPWKQFFNFNGFIVLIGFIGLLKAYVEAEDMNPLAARYEQMESILIKRGEQSWNLPESPSVFRRFVAESERLMRDENTEWTAKRGNMDSLVLSPPPLP